MTTNEAVPLLSPEAAHVAASEFSSAYGPDIFDALNAIASGAAVVIPASAILKEEATERVDVERVRAVIAEIDHYTERGGGETLQEIKELYTKWADELAAAIGDKK